MDRCYRFHHYRLLPGRRLLLEGADETRPVKLRSRAFDMLVALVERHDRVVTKHELMALVWPRLVVEENNLQVQVLSLRKLLGHGAIATIPGRGYRFTLPLEGETEATEAPVIQPPGEPSTDGNLPEQLPPLFGRADELHALERLIAAHRVVTVTGAGGIGKTRLAQGAAAQRALQQSVWWVELAPLADPELVPAAVCQALGLSPQGQVDATTAAARALKGLSALVVLDNAEHLLDAVAAFIRVVRVQAPGVKMLVTSQEVMRDLEEQVFRPGPLALPSGDDLAAARGSGAVALFVARAQQADARFVLDDGNVAAVVEICRRLDGIPLAIELAAARVPLLGVEGLRQRLDERFRVLTAGARAVMRRHQTLRAALEWSHGLLLEAERLVFRRLGVFAGSFSLEAAQDVACDDTADRWEVLEHLGALVDKSLVVVEGEAVPRYRMLETTRLFALEQLAEVAETEPLLKLHAQWCVDLAEAFEAEVGRTGFRASGLLERLDLERANLLHALSWCSRSDDVDAPGLGLRLVAALRYYWPAQGLTVIGWHATRQAIERAAALPADAVRCMALTSAVQLLHSMNRHEEVEPLVQELMRIGRTLSLDATLSIAHQWSGETAMRRRDWPKAGMHFREQRALAIQMGNLTHEGNALQGLARMTHAQGRHQEALALIEDLLIVRRRSGNAHNIASSLQLASHLAICDGQVDRAAAHLTEAGPWVNQVGSRLLRLGWCSLGASLAAARAHWLAAVRLHAFVARVREQDGVRPSDADLESELAELHSARDILGAEAYDAAWVEGGAWDERHAMACAEAELTGQSIAG